MFRYKLRTLLILLAILPPLLGVAWVKYAAWKAEQARRAELAKMPQLEIIFDGIQPVYVQQLSSFFDPPEPLPLADPPSN